LIPDHLSEAPRNGNGKKAAADGVPLTAILISELCNLKLQLTSLLGPTKISIIRILPPFVFR
jgi:hypothetical protein